MEFKNRFIDVTNNPIVIVGECPGRQRKKDQNREVFHGNRTGDFIEKIIEGVDNIILTNACNFQKPCSTINKLIGQQDLENLLTQQKPSKVISLGSYARQSVDYFIHNGANGLTFKHVQFPHPSYVLRFNKKPKEYFEQLKKELQ